MFKTIREFDRLAKEGVGGMTSAWHSISALSYNRNVPTQGDGGTQV